MVGIGRGPPCTNLRRTVRPKEPCNVLRHTEKAQEAQLYNRLLVSGNSMRYPQEVGSIEKNAYPDIYTTMHTTNNLSDGLNYPNIFQTKIRWNMRK